ncbi:MAG TPA: methyltetrahydrofolate cobalamin methyltransferase [Candidatus Acetothermia bacterium]|nr:methyltetrahydrofolate cobalamin methyltransferase [Candidatus Acetothermia bacterium]
MKTFIIGELINSSRPQVKEAISRRDEGVIRRLARAQVEAGADALDLNAAESMEREPDDLRWLVEVVQDELGEVRLSIDTANPEAMEAGLSACRAQPIVNSISNEATRRPIIELAARTEAEVIGLPMGQAGMPKTAEERLAEARALIEACEKAGIPRERLMIDVLCMSVGSNPDQGLAALAATRKIKELGVRTCAAVSNVSFGLPRRKLLNRTYLAMLAASGVDAVILDPTDQGMMETLLAAEALTGKDKYCMEYIRYQRKS